MWLHCLYLFRLFPDTVATFKTHALSVALLWDDLIASFSLLGTKTSWLFIAIGGTIVIKVAGVSARHVDRYGQQCDHFDQYSPVKNGQGYKKVTTNVKTYKIHVLQLDPMCFEPLGITYILYLDMLNV